MMRNKRKWLLLLLRLLLIATLCFIWGNSMLPGEESGSISRMVYEWLVAHGVPVPSEHFVRKAAHFCEFAVVGVEYALLFWAKSGLSFQNLCNAAFAALLTAMTDETIQMFSADRGSALKDVLLDFSGAVTGILFTALLICVIQKLKEKSGSRA